MSLGIDILPHDNFLGLSSVLDLKWFKQKGHMCSVDNFVQICRNEKKQQQEIGKTK